MAISTIYGDVDGELDGDVGGDVGGDVERVGPVRAASEVADAASLFRGLADPARLAILRRVATGECRVVDLTAHLGLAQSTVSAHCACLRDCGLLDSRPQGRATCYSLAARPELLDLLAAAERLLTATGRAVALCPTYGTEAHR